MKRGCRIRGCAGTEAQWQPDSGREYRGQWRPALGLLGFDVDFSQRSRRSGTTRDRRLYTGPAILSRFRPGLVRKRTRTSLAEQGSHRSAFPRPVAGERGSAKLRPVWQRVQLQEGGPDVPGELLPRMVIRARWKGLFPKIHHPHILHYRAFSPRLRYAFDGWSQAAFLDGKAASACSLRSTPGASRKWF